jgi:hypothetical protein
MAEYICPRCRKPVYDDEALFCLYCGESLGRPAGFIDGLRRCRWAVTAVVLLIAALLSFLVMLMG